MLYDFTQLINKFHGTKHKTTFSNHKTSPSNQPVKQAGGKRTNRLTFPHSSILNIYSIYSQSKQSEQASAKEFVQNYNVPCSYTPHIMLCTSVTNDRSNTKIFEESEDEMSGNSRSRCHYIKRSVESNCVNVVEGEKFRVSEAVQELMQAVAWIRTSG